MEYSKIIKVVMGLLSTEDILFLLKEHESDIKLYLSEDDKKDFYEVLDFLKKEESSKFLYDCFVNLKEGI